jgi:agmatinase
MTKEEIIAVFDPNGTADQNAGLYGLPFTVPTAEVVILPVPWEVTVSYRGGTSRGPGAMRMASYQVDLFDEDVPDAWKLGLALDDISGEWLKQSSRVRKNAIAVIDFYESGTGITELDAQDMTQEINAECAALHQWVEERCAQYLEMGKIPAVLGGDHSTPLGLIKALAAKYPSFGILQVDAHADLRDAYEGFEFSHASIMFNALKVPQVGKLVQVGLRDICEDEVNLAAASNGRVVQHTWRQLSAATYRGVTWDAQCDAIVAGLPKDVYISFDIDGLDPSLCPNTGTPVPGGLQYEEAVHLMRKVVESGRRIIGFDLVEVSPGSSEWDAIVGARLLLKMCNLAGKSQGRI